VLPPRRPTGHSTGRNDHSQGLRKSILAQIIAALGQAADPLAEERSAQEVFLENRMHIHVS